MSSAIATPFEFLSGLGEVAIICQVISGGIFAGLNVSNYCDIDNSINDLQEEIKTTKEAWDAAIAAEGDLKDKAFQEQNENLLTIQKMTKATQQLQDMYIYQMKSLKLTIFVLVLTTVGTLLIKGLLRKQNELKGN